MTFCIPDMHTTKHNAIQYVRASRITFFFENYLYKFDIIIKLNIKHCYKLWHVNV